MAKAEAPSITKQAAVQQALTELGSDAKGKDLLAFVKEKFGLEVTLNHLSNIKSTLKNKTGKRGPGRPGKAVAETPPSNEGAKATNGAGISVADILAVRQLTQKLGAKGLKELVDALG